MDILSIDPRPLVFSKRKIVISWSPKAGCSHVIVWFFIKEGLLQAVNHYHKWPHNYRTQVYYKTATYKRDAAKLYKSGGEGYTLIKITRDPAKRLVSIFRHLCRHRVLYNKLSEKLNLDARKDGVSLLDLQKYLDGENLTPPTKVNPHFCAQVHPIWNIPFDRIVTLNMDQTDLNSGLNSIEKEFGLKKTNFDSVQKFKQIRENHYGKDTIYKGAEPIEEHRFFPSELDTGFPKSQLSESSILQNMARDFYTSDFGRVDSGDTQGKLFT